MNFKDSMRLFSEFTTYYYDNSDILPGEDDRFYCCAVNSVREISVIIEIAVRTFSCMEQGQEEMRGIFQDYDKVKKYWKTLKIYANQKYPEEHWRKSLHNEN